MLLFVPRTKIVSNFVHSSIWHAPCKSKDKPPRQGWQIFEGQNFEGATTMTTAFKNRKTFSAAICAALLFGATMILSSIGPARASHVVAAERSDEHTSELQSLMRISYAVFCLKKKTKDIRSCSRRRTTMK